MTFNYNSADLENGSKDQTTKANTSKKTKKPANIKEKGKVSKPRTRIPFNRVEDQQLIKLVNDIGTDKKNSWHIIADHMIGRSARQCRERYQLYLSNGIKKKEKWTKEEDDLLISKYTILGPKWKTMEQYFKGRNSYSIKNRFISLTRKINKNWLLNISQQSKINQNQQNTEKAENNVINDESYLDNEINGNIFYFNHDESQNNVNNNEDKKQNDDDFDFLGGNFF